MPYDGEYAGYRPLQRIAESEQVKQLLQRARVRQRGTQEPSPLPPKSAPAPDTNLPRFILAIDGSNAEVDVVTGYPGAKIGYCTVASVLIDLSLVHELDKDRPVDPKKFRETEEAAAFDAAFPGCNVVTRRRTSAVESFREELYDLFNGIILDDENRISLLNTYETLLAFKPSTHHQQCPYNESNGCNETLIIPVGSSVCPACRCPLYSTDSLRIHERFNSLGANGEAYGYVMQVWERLLLIHILRCFEQRDMLALVSKLAFFLDGPLAIFGPPAWLSAAINKELKRINEIVREKTRNDLIILGINKGGEFVQHFDEIDRTETPGQLLFSNRQYMLLTDSYIKESIQQSTSPKRYGLDTYFGRKFFYKTSNGSRIVGDIPFLTDEQDTIETDNIALYPQFGMVCTLLDHLVSSRLPNALSPIISAHAQASIPLHLGAKVLKQLAQALLGRD